MIAKMKPGENRLPSEDDLARLMGISRAKMCIRDSVCAVWGAVDVEAIRNVAMEFGGVEHRIEFVREKDGVRWYNDSIATTPTRTIAGLDSFGQKLIVIAGGYDKKVPFDPMVPKVVEKVKTLVLIGATADKIEKMCIRDNAPGAPLVFRAPGRPACLLPARRSGM